MRTIFITLFLLLNSAIVFAQLNETFTDGDFTANPAWTGDIALFKVNAAQQLQLNAAVAGAACLSTPVTIGNSMEWNFYVRLAFSPSSSNMARVYLLSDKADLKTALNGVYLQLGETGSADALSLMKQTGTSSTLICRGKDSLVAKAFAIRVKVTRTPDGAWKLFADPNGGADYVLQAAGSDNLFIPNAYFGIFCKYTASNITKFYFDDFMIKPLVIDTLAPQLVSVDVTDSRHIWLNFSEALDAVSASIKPNYLVRPDNILPDSIKMVADDPSRVDLVFNTAFLADKTYSVSVNGIKDVSGNSMKASELTFSFHLAKAFDILINEIMADPSPPVKLPNAEYIELYNRSDFETDITGWKLIICGSEKTLPAYKIPKQGYVMITATANKPLFDSSIPALGLSSLSLTNAGCEITLQGKTGEFIHSVAYSDSWYNDVIKKDGGWSLEMVDAANPCTGVENWKASVDPSGGTPGRANSVKTMNTDTKPPHISRIGVVDNTHITVWFTETCSYAMLSNPAIYVVDKGIGSPISALPHFPDFKSVDLIFEKPILKDAIYTLSCSAGITDCVGNPLGITTAKFGLPFAAQQNDLVINEILFNPKPEGADFIEVFNRSSKIIDLSTLILANYDTVTNQITKYCTIAETSTLLFPNQYWVLTPDSAKVKCCYRTDNPLNFSNINPFIALNDDEGTVALAERGGKIIDKMYYAESMHFPLLTEMEGVSLERINPDRPAADKQNWHSAAATVGYATPTYINSQFGKITDENKDEVTLLPEIFSPDDDGYNDNLLIDYKFEQPGNMLTLRVFDTNGQPIKIIANNQLCGATGSYTWDGTTDNRQKAAIGRYIVLVEVFDLNGKVKRYKKTVVVAGKL